VQGGDSRLRILGVGHLDEAKSTGLARFPIIDGTRGIYLTVLLENFP